MAGARGDSESDGPIPRGMCYEVVFDHEETRGVRRGLGKARTCWWDLWKPPTPMCIMPLLHAARSTIGGGLKVTLGRSGTVPSGEAILRISARTTKRASLPLLVCGVARMRDARRSASGAASAVLKPIIAATCAAIVRLFDRPFRQPRFDTTAATKESDEPSRPSWLALQTSPASQPRFLGKAGFSQTDSLFTVLNRRL